VSFEDEEWEMREIHEQFKVHIEKANAARKVRQKSIASIWNTTMVI